MLLVEAAQIAVRCDPGMRSEYLHRCHRKAKGVAKVAAARKLAIRLYWMLRTTRQVSSRPSGYLSGQHHGRSASVNSEPVLHVFSGEEKEA